MSERRPDEAADDFKAWYEESLGAANEAGYGPCSAAEAIRGLDAENKDLRARLFPYADAKEVSGISFDGKYLIGDKASVDYFREMANRGEQIDIYKRSYDENLAALQAKVDRLLASLKVIAEVDDDGFTSDGHERCVEWAERTIAEVTA